MNSMPGNDPPGRTIRNRSPIVRSATVRQYGNSRMMGRAAIAQVFAHSQPRLATTNNKRVHLFDISFPFGEEPLHSVDDEWTRSDEC